MEIGWDEILLDDPSKGIFEMELEDMARPVDETEMDMDEVIDYFITFLKKYFYLFDYLLDYNILNIVFCHFKFSFFLVSFGLFLCLIIFLVVQIQ